MNPQSCEIFLHPLKQIKGEIKKIELNENKHNQDLEIQLKQDLGKFITENACM
jgi:hypothetical protein